MLGWREFVSSKTAGWWIGWVVGCAQFKLRGFRTQHVPNCCVSSRLYYLSSFLPHRQCFTYLISFLPISGPSLHIHSLVFLSFTFFKTPDWKDGNHHPVYFSNGAFLQVVGSKEAKHARFFRWADTLSKTLQVDQVKWKGERRWRFNWGLILCGGEVIDERTS